MQVNNAGLLAKAPVLDAGVEHFRRVMDVNFFGVVEMCTAVTPQMVQRQAGEDLSLSSSGVWPLASGSVTGMQPLAARVPAVAGGCGVAAQAATQCSCSS